GKSQENGCNATGQRPTQRARTCHGAHSCGKRESVVRHVWTGLYAICGGRGNGGTVRCGTGAGGGRGRGRQGRGGWGRRGRRGWGRQGRGDDGRYSGNATGRAANEDPQPALTARGPRPVHRYFARSRYFPSRGSTRTRSPWLMNEGTWTVTPLERRAGLVIAVLVAPAIAGSVSTTSSSREEGSSTPIGLPSWNSAWMTMFSVSHCAASPRASSSSASISNVSLFMKW